MQISIDLRNAQHQKGRTLQKNSNKISTMTITTTKTSSHMHQLSSISIFKKKSDATRVD
jgi:hypothetical protein